MNSPPVLLFLCGGRRVGLLRRFRAALEPLGGRVLTTDTEPWSAASFVAHGTYRVAPCAEAGRFREDVADLCGAEGVSAILPLTCSAVAAMPALAGHVDGVLVGGDAAAVEVATDKRRTIEHFQRAKLPTPAIVERPGDGDLPLFRRFRRSEGSRGALSILTAGDLALVRDDSDQVFTRHLSGPEYSVDCYKGLDGTLRTIVPRLRMRVRGGEVEKAVTVRDETLIALVSRAVENLRFVGPATVQAIRQEDRFYLTEINLRYAGGVTLSIEAGADTPAWLVAELAGGQAPPSPAIRWGLGMARYDEDLYFEMGETLDEP